MIASFSVLLSRRADVALVTVSAQDRQSPRPAREDQVQGDAAAMSNFFSEVKQRKMNRFERAAKSL